jgi:hypothetical protein
MVAQYYSINVDGSRVNDKVPVEKFDWSEVYDIITDKIVLLDFLHFG